MAIIHDHFYTFGGAEKTVEAWLQLYPQATVYTNFITLENFKGSIFEKLYTQGQLRTTAEQLLLSKRRPTLFKLLFWLHPIMARFGINIDAQTDLVLLSSVYSAKYARFPKAPIIHYCHSPTRFLYSGMRTELDHERFHLLVKLVLTPIKFILRIWDQAVVKRLKQSNVYWITNSTYNQKIIQNIYNVESAVVFPPIDTHRFLTTEHQKNKKGYVVFGRIVPIKKIERAIQACIALNEPLTIIGYGNEDYITQLKQISQHSPLIQFQSDANDKKKMQMFGSVQAMLFPALEDFGIAPIEVMGAGLPVIALKGAGALEYLQPGINGEFFEAGDREEQTVHNLIQALQAFKVSHYNPNQVQESVRRFNKLHTQEIKTIISKLL